MRVSGNRQTISEFAASVSERYSEYEGLDAVICALAEGATRVNREVQDATLVDALGTTGETNVQGELVQRLDSMSSDTFVDVLRNSQRVAAVGCEELEAPVFMDQEPGGDFSQERNDYIVLMDPLDGSSNIDVAVSIGSIFGIWKHDKSEPLSERSLLRPGNEQIAAVYVVYGSSTVMVVAISNRVEGFTLDEESDVFLATHPDLIIPPECPYYSTNEGNFKVLDDSTRAAVSTLRDRYSLRYVGSLVADFHRNLLKGGIFLYPGDKNRPGGRLRLMYEANPLGFVAEQAGGSASDGVGRIMDIVPEQLHQRTPLILGNKNVVEEVLGMING